MYVRRQIIVKFRKSHCLPLTNHQYVAKIYIQFIDDVIVLSRPVDYMKYICTRHLRKYTPST